MQMFTLDSLLLLFIFLNNIDIDFATVTYTLDPHPVIVGNSTDCERIQNKSSSCESGKVLTWLLWTQTGINDVIKSSFHHQSMILESQCRQLCFANTSCTVAVTKEPFDCWIGSTATETFISKHHHVSSVLACCNSQPARDVTHEITPKSSSSAQKCFRIPRDDSLCRNKTWIKEENHSSVVWFDLQRVRNVTEENCLSLCFANPWCLAVDYLFSLSECALKYLHTTIISRGGREILYSFSCCDDSNFYQRVGRLNDSICRDQPERSQNCNETAGESIGYLVRYNFGVEDFGVNRNISHCRNACTQDDTCVLAINDYNGNCQLVANVSTLSLKSNLTEQESAMRSCCRSRKLVYGHEIINVITKPDNELVNCTNLQQKRDACVGIGWMKKQGETVKGGIITTIYGVNEINCMQICKDDPACIAIVTFMTNVPESHCHLIHRILTYTSNANAITYNMVCCGND